MENEVNVMPKHPTFGYESSGDPQWSQLVDYMSDSLGEKEARKVAQSIMHKQISLRNAKGKRKYQTRGVR